ncbi:Uncharacterized protein FWK35_00022913 [Aphis craccivora]|uniref:Uncharacterized protein n=1 Tax=Aphis craccivora TaxID=307492 RepID=A0A6G0Z4D4_APHCR|nr:Uncharacterized protein FWK35_00022913 [Aphis craccivora]
MHIVYFQLKYHKYNFYLSILNNSNLKKFFFYSLEISIQTCYNHKYTYETTILLFTFFKRKLVALTITEKKLTQTNKENNYTKNYWRSRFFLRLYIAITCTLQNQLDQYVLFRNFEVENIIKYVLLLLHFRITHLTTFGLYNILIPIITYLLVEPRVSHLVKSLAESHVIVVLFGKLKQYSRGRLSHRVRSSVVHFLAYGRRFFQVQLVAGRDEKRTFGQKVSRVG